MARATVVVLLLLLSIPASFASETNWSIGVSASTTGWQADRWNIVGVWSQYTDGLDSSITYISKPPNVEGAPPTVGPGQWVAIRQQTSPLGVTDMRAKFIGHLQKVWDMRVYYYLYGVSGSPPSSLTVTAKPSVDWHGNAASAALPYREGTTEYCYEFEAAFIPGGSVTYNYDNQLPSTGVTWTINAPHELSNADSLRLTVWTQDTGADTTPPSVQSVTAANRYVWGGETTSVTWTVTDDLSGVAESSYAIGSSPSDLIVGWKSAGASTTAGESTGGMQPGCTYYWYIKACDNAGNWSAPVQSLPVTAVQPVSVGEARSTFVGSPCAIENAVVTSLSSSPAGLWVESENRASAVMIPSVSGVSLGDRLDIAGVLAWQDGLPTLSSPELHDKTAGEQLGPVGFSQSGLATDLTESLTYCGINPVGLLVTVWGTVTQSDPASHAFYIEDGSNLADGMGPTSDPFVGIRVLYADGMNVPTSGTARVTGIRGVQKVVLDHDTVVNRVRKTAGSTLYLPTVVIRDQSDVVSIQ